MLAPHKKVFVPAPPINRKAPGSSPEITTMGTRATVLMMLL